MATVTDFINKVNGEIKTNFVRYTVNGKKEAQVLRFMDGKKVLFLAVSGEKFISSSVFKKMRYATDLCYKYIHS